MMSYTLKLTPDQIRTLLNIYNSYSLPLTNDYTIFRGKINSTTLTIYKTNVATFQGQNAVELYKYWVDKFEITIEEESLEEKATSQELAIPNLNLSLIGTDEVGTGDFFGAVVVAGAYVPKENILMLKKLGIKDSKKVSDDKVMEIAPKLVKIVEHSAIILNNQTYNNLMRNEYYNLNKIKAVLHNNVIINLTRKLAEDNIKYDNIIVDGFTTKSKYFEYLANEKTVIKDVEVIQKAEEKYIAVAAASIIARYLFLRHLQKLSNACKYQLIKGAGPEVDKLAAKIISEQGENYLQKIAKLNFKNLEKAHKIIEKK